MFCRGIRGDAQVVVEIAPRKSREVLVSNRDSLMQTCANELDSFIQSIAVDTRSALKSHGRKVITLGRNPRVTRRKTKNKAVAEVLVAAIRPSDPNMVGSGRRAAEVGQLEYETSDKAIIDDLVGSAVIICESENPDVRKVVDSYDPRNWQWTEWAGRPGKPYLKGRVKRDLLRIWTIACDAVLESWLEIQQEDEISWRPGFIFSDEDLAAFSRAPDGAAALLLNPVDDKGKLKFSIRKQEDWSVLITLAAHEVVHFVAGYHDENWASIMTDLVGKIMGRKKEIVRRIKDILKRD